MYIPYGVCIYLYVYIYAKCICNLPPSHARTFARASGCTFACRVYNKYIIYNKYTWKAYHICICLNVYQYTIWDLFINQINLYSNFYLHKNKFYKFILS